MSGRSHMPNIELRREIPIYKIEAVIEMQQRVDRGELIALLRFVKETIDEGEKLTPQKVVDDWLIGFPVSSGKRLLRILEDLKLIQRENRRGKMELLPTPTTSYVLTEKGQETEATDTLFMPERRAVTIGYAIDPLIPDRIISINTQTDKLMDHIENKLGRKELEEYESIDLPEELEKIVGHRIEVYEGDCAGQIIIDLIKPRVIRLQRDSTVQLNLQLSPQRSPRLTIKTGSHTHDVALNKKLEDQLNYMKVLASLIRQTGKSWSEAKEAVPLRFNETDYSQRVSFETDIHIPKPEIANLGQFQPCTIKKVPIAPKTLRDGQRWYEFLIVERIQSYMTQTGFESYAERQKHDFIRFGFDLATPTIDELIEKYSLREDSTYHPIYWFLNAPGDLSMERSE